MNKHSCWMLLFGVVLLTVGCGRDSGNGGGSADSLPGGPEIVRTKSGINMVLIPAGTFEMGSRHRDDEKPVHTVRIDAFYMDVHEVKQADFERIGKDAPDQPLSNPSKHEGPDLPVEQVRMHDACHFCNARSILEGLEPCYIKKGNSFECDFSKNGYRLPTEAEWEYACRAGTDTDYAFGSNDKQLGEYGWYEGNSGKETHPVAQKKPNPWGLYDMHGNVAEWCHDIYGRGYYAQSPADNPRGPSAGEDYVLRGGSWKSKAPMLRSAYRVHETPGFSDACLAKDAIGFRCVRKAP
jgi:formylglycine-generating enzyme